MEALDKALRVRSLLAPFVLRRLKGEVARQLTPKRHEVIEVSMQGRQLALYEAQLISQNSETKSARETLREAANEMESIAFEKKQLLQQWRASLISMARRDEALKATEDALGELRERDMTLEMEISGYKKAIQVLGSPLQHLG
jgi:SNF2 family DNA or RNA helicase